MAHYREKNMLRTSMEKADFPVNVRRDSLLNMTQLVYMQNTGFHMWVQEPRGQSIGCESFSFQSVGGLNTRSPWCVPFSLTVHFRRIFLVAYLWRIFMYKESLDNNFTRESLYWMVNWHWFFQQCRPMCHGKESMHTTMIKHN